MASPSPASLPEGSPTVAIETMVVKSENSENLPMPTETKCGVIGEPEKIDQSNMEEDDEAMEEPEVPIDLTVASKIKPEIEDREEEQEEQEDAEDGEGNPEQMEVDEQKAEVFAVPELPVKSETDPAVERLKKEINCAIRVYQKYFDDMNLAHKMSLPNISSYTRAVILRKMNASTVHIDGYNTKIEMAQTVEQLQTLLDEIRVQNKKARQSQEINALLGDPF